MVGAAFYIFWTGIFVVSYTYLGYGIVIFILSKIRGRPHTLPPSSRVQQADPAPVVHELPVVTILIAAFNEENFIEEKIKNTLALDYPADKLSILIVTDGSTDRTPEMVRQCKAVQLFHQPERKGKIHAVNRVMKFVKNPVVIFSDANTFLNREAIKNLVRHYQDEKVGGVAGEKRIFVKKEDNASASGEGLYWKYESFLKRRDAEVYSVVGAAGELFSVRTLLYEEPAENMIIEDFYLSLRIAMKGYRFLYEPAAYAMENAASSVAEEWKRKVRISAGGFQAITKLRPLLNPLKYGMLSFQYISHRVLR